ncbi:MAG: hypothetical protein ACK5JT_00440, partial [Hyphomicrobiaceae bacterium]
MKIVSEKGSLEWPIKNKRSQVKTESRREIAHLIAAVLSRLGKPVVLRDLAFNGFSLPEELDLEQRNVNLTLPNIYLDN